MRRLLVLVAAVALATPAGATAKSWIGFAAPPGGVAVGERWDATLTFPLHPDAPPLPRRPELVFTHFDSYDQRRFVAGPTSERGVYRAQVELPRAGRWSVYVYVYAREIGSVTPDPRSNEVLVRPRPGGAGSDAPFAAAASLFAVVLVLIGAASAKRRSRAHLSDASARITT
jgi:hypothetical protein